MPAQIPPGDVNRALQTLNISPNEFEAIRLAPFPQAQELLKRLKAKAKREFRRLAPKLHPDRNDGDESKTELFKLLVRVLDDVEKLQVSLRPIRPRFSVSYVVRNQTTPATGAGLGFRWPHVNTSMKTPMVGYTPEQIMRIVKMRPK